MKHFDSIVAVRFPYVSTATLRKYFEIGKFGEAELRAKLPSPLYWIQPERKVLWNLSLIRDFLLNNDGPEHQRLIEEYLATLEPPKHGGTPKSQPRKAA